MDNTTDRRILKTRNAIHESFAELIQEMPYSKITVTKLAQNANIDRRTFYLHYENIDDVAKDMQQIAVDMIVEEINKHSDYKLETFLESINVVVEKRLNFYKTIFNEPSCFGFIQDAVNSLKYCILSSSKGCEIKGFLRSYYADYIANGIIGIYTNWFKQDNPKESLQDILDIAKKSVTEANTIL